jgi:hypothetical protein
LFGLDGDDATQASTWSPVGLQPGAKEYCIRRQVMIRNKLSERSVVRSAGETNSQGCFEQSLGGRSDPVNHDVVAIDAVDVETGLVAAPRK